MNVVVANRQRVKKIDSRLLKEITSDILADLEIEHCELEINLVAAPEMTALNETFLRHEGSTDVITFDYSEGKKLRQNVGVSGEIFICVDEAIVQARKFKTTWQSEVARYVVHGILHLLGHDDSRPAARRRMKREENRLLNGRARRFSLAEIGHTVKLSA